MTEEQFLRSEINSLESDIRKSEKRLQRFKERLASITGHSEDKSISVKQNDKLNNPKSQFTGIHKIVKHNRTSKPQFIAPLGIEAAIETSAEKLHYSKTFGRSKEQEDQKIYYHGKLRSRSEIRQLLAIYDEPEPERALPSESAKTETLPTIAPMEMRILTVPDEEYSFFSSLAHDACASVMWFDLKEDELVNRVPGAGLKGPFLYTKVISCTYQYNNLYLLSEGNKKFLMKMQPEINKRYIFISEKENWFKEIEKCVMEYGLSYVKYSQQ